MKKILFLIFFICFALSSGQAWAKGPFNKFGRGVTNIVTSPLEYGVQTAGLGEAGENDYLTAFFGGLLKGTVFMAARVLAEVPSYPPVQSVFASVP